MPELTVYVKTAKSMSVSMARIINTENVVVGNWARIKNQYWCERYGNYLACPPYSPTPDYTNKKFDEYAKGIFLQIENISLRGSKLHRYSRERQKIQSKSATLVANLERKIFLVASSKVFGMPAEPCSVCRGICDTTKPCRHPYQARPSMEVCGIDVYRTARYSGFKLEIVRSPDSPFSLLGLFNSIFMN